MGMKSVIELLRELREDNDLSQSEVAAVLGISQHIIRHMKTGDMNCHCGTLLNWRITIKFRLIICWGDIFYRKMEGLRESASPVTVQGSNL